MYTSGIMEHPREKIQRFFSSHVLIRYKKHETLIHAETLPPGVFYLTKGYIRQYALSLRGQEFTILIFQPGDLFPLRWAITGLQNTFFFEAMTPATLSLSPKDEFLA